MKASAELRRSGQIILPDATQPDLPVKNVTDKLYKTDGKELEIVTRANPMLIRAVTFGNVYCGRFNSKYAQGRVDQLMRLAISMEGQGRTDLIECLRAGGSTPDAYFSAETQNKKKEFRYLRTSGSDEESE